MIRLWETDIPGYNPALSKEVPYLVPFLTDKDQRHGAVIICPGGGYDHLAQHEGAPVAEWLNKIGLSAFVLNYRLAPYQHPIPMFDGQRALRYVRYHAQEWNLDSEKIGILGFSAGGHLAAITGTQFDLGDPESKEPIERMSSRPNAMILCYPVITLGQFCHSGSKERLLGTSPTEEMIAYLSAEKNITSQTPPTFLWHTANDASVPVENSLMMAEALSEYKIPFEMHIFPEGKHGLGLAPNQPEIAIWKVLCEKWLEKIGFLSSATFQ